MADALLKDTVLEAEHDLLCPYPGVRDGVFLYQQNLTADRSGRG